LFTLRDLGNDKTIIKLAEDELNLKLNGKDTPEEDKKMRATAATRYLVLLAFLWELTKEDMGNHWKRLKTVTNTQKRLSSTLLTPQLQHDPKKYRNYTNTRETHDEVAFVMAS